MKKFPHYTARKVDVQTWLASWFTDRNIKTSRLSSDKSLWLILKQCTWTGKTIREAKPSELESALVALGLADYVAARLMVDIAEQKTQQCKAIIHTIEELPSPESRKSFINALPPPEASAADVSEWLCSWFDGLDFRNQGLQAETTINDLGLDGESFRQTIQDDRSFVVGTLHLRNGFSWNHMFGIAEDVREALKREGEKNGGGTKKRKLSEALPFRGHSSHYDFPKAKAVKQDYYDMDSVSTRYGNLIDQPVRPNAAAKSMREDRYDLQEITSRYSCLLDQSTESDTE